MATIAYYLLKDNEVSYSLKIEVEHTPAVSTLSEARLRNLLVSCRRIESSLKEVYLRQCPTWIEAQRL